MPFFADEYCGLYDPSANTSEALPKQEEYTQQDDNTANLAPPPPPPPVPSSSSSPPPPPPLPPSDSSGKPQNINKKNEEKLDFSDSDDDFSAPPPPQTNIPRASLHDELLGRLNPKKEVTSKQVPGVFGDDDSDDGDLFGKTSDQPKEKTTIDASSTVGNKPAAKATNTLFGSLDDDDEEGDLFSSSVSVRPKTTTGVGKPKSDLFGDNDKPEPKEEQEQEGKVNIDDIAEESKSEAKEHPAEIEQSMRIFFYVCF